MENINLYEIAKILHIISFTAWFAGLFYLPRLFVYHTQVEKSSESYNIFIIMEKKLFRYIMNPAMIATLIFGIYMTSIIGLDYGWLHAKITIVILLVGFHHYLGSCRKKFVNLQNQKSEKFYRIINEIPTIALILIVTLVIMKPF